MMNLNDIKNYEFKPAGRNAYRADDVDTFLAEVVIVCEKLYRENNELMKRINLLADRLEEYKKDEGDIKQAVISAQKAADIIIRDAKSSVEDCKAEADAILAAAKGEAAVIRSDAEKQAIADSDLIISKTKDKAEDIINKAKEKAHGILIAANNSASDKMGAANRTITSESLHYDMLKKEVSEFRASILAQYKTHIELISKLPELAVEEAAKIEPETTNDELDITEEEIENPVFVPVEAEEDTVLEYIQGERIDDVITPEAFEVNDEDVVKTTLPYEFFGENEPQIEFVDEDDEDNSLDVEYDEGAISFANRNPISLDDTASVTEQVNEPVGIDYNVGNEDADNIRSTNFTINVEDVNDFEDNSAQMENQQGYSNDLYEDISSSSQQQEEENSSYFDFEEEEPEQVNDIKSEYGSYSSFFDSIELLDVEKAEATFDEQNKHKGFFRKK